MLLLVNVQNQSMSIIILISFLNLQLATNKNDHYYTWYIIHHQALCPMLSQLDYGRDKDAIVDKTLR